MPGFVHPPWVTFPIGQLPLTHLGRSQGEQRMEAGCSDPSQDWGQLTLKQKLEPLSLLKCEQLPPPGLRELEGLAHGSQQPSHIC